jgi:CPA1 family monovalent cation:H+ antiporter
MSYITIVAVLLAMTATISYLNDRYFKLPTTIAMLTGAIVISMVVVVMQKMGWTDFGGFLIDIIKQIDFSKILLEGLLGFLLFAGAIHVGIHDLQRDSKILIFLVSICIVVATLIYGVIIFVGFNIIGIEIDFLYSLIFGALITPTDPIAVMAVLSKIGLPKRLENLISGESLLNDGVGYAVFAILLGLKMNLDSFGIQSGGMLLVKEIFGGILLGVIVGTIAYRLLKRTKSTITAVFISLADIMVCFAIAEAYHFSGPLAVVSSGILLSSLINHITVIREKHSEYKIFWHILDSLLNGFLFLLIGVQMLIIDFNIKIIIGSLIAIFASLISRFISVSIPIILFRANDEKIDARTIDLMKLLTWGGLRGGLSLAMAMSLPESNLRMSIIAITFGVVSFSIIIQGLTIGKMFKYKKLLEISKV